MGFAVSPIALIMHERKQVVIQFLIEYMRERYINCIAILYWSSPAHRVMGVFWFLSSSAVSVVLIHFVRQSEVVYQQSHDTYTIIRWYHAATIYKCIGAFSQLYISIKHPKIGTCLSTGNNMYAYLESVVSIPKVVIWFEHVYIRMLHQLVC